MRRPGSGNGRAAVELKVSASGAAERAAQLVVPVEGGLGFIDSGRPELMDDHGRRKSIYSNDLTYGETGQSGNSCCFGSGRKKLAAKPTTYTTRPTIAEAQASFSVGEPGRRPTSDVVASAADVPIMRPPTFAAKPSPVPRRCVG